MLTDGAAARSVLVESGLLEKLRPGSVVLEMSTIGPAAVGELAAEAHRHDVQLLDAPVSGSVSVAEAAQLFVMVGGDPDAYERVTPVLDAMTKGHALLGPSGTGAAMKVAVNAMIAVTNESLAETLVLAERFGIERERAYDVIAGGVLASPFLLYKRNAFLQPGTEPVAFTTDLMRKDVALAEDLAAELGARVPAVAAAAGVLDDAVRDGLGDADFASVISVLSDNPTT
jgi:3-hydroxyisobutyrate dehydrogenase/2-hydroxy-3-oxopropionate reductase